MRSTGGSLSGLKLVLMALLLASGAFLRPEALRLGEIGASVAEAQPGIAGVAQAQTQEGPEDIQWFKKTMNIAPKYQEQRSGVLGMSWPHFILMIFLLLFFLATLLNYYLRSKRTKDILRALFEEDRSREG